MDARQNEQFTAYLQSAVREVERFKYFPSRFKAMLAADGGFETVNRILASGRPSEGFERLWELGRVDLTCEAIIVESQWRPYFDSELLLRAENLLRGVGYVFKRFEPVRLEATVLEGAGAAEHGMDRVQADNDDVGLDAHGGLGVNAFFKDVLHAPVANVRWSWGGVDERARRVFLRLWNMDVQFRPGLQLIRVLSERRTNRPGWNERVRHLDLVRSGYEAFAVMCDKESADSSAIRNFDRKTLQRLGRILEIESEIYMEVVEAVAVQTLREMESAADALVADLNEIRSADVPETTREALVAARLGQGSFRRDLLHRWDRACAVTGCRVVTILRASHCKPWRDSDNRERLDPSNGLLLSANLDALFDAGLIAFEDDGSMLVSGDIPHEQQRALAIPAPLRRRPDGGLSGYLRYHREQSGLKRQGAG